MSRSGKLFLILNLWLFASLWPSGACALNRILSVRHWVAPDHTRVVIDTTEDVHFATEKEERRVLLDLEDTEFPSHLPQQIPLNKPSIEGVAFSPHSSSSVRVELLLPESAQTNIFQLKKYQDKPYRIVIDIVLPEVARQESEARERIKTMRKDRIIVIDPGHGGEAVGAVGKDGVFEKDVVLSIARKLRDILNGRGGYRAFLTRDGDYYVSFKKRLMIAREYGADLFVSVHADAAKSRLACGTSVYCLSARGATSEAAKIIARNENLADIVGGVSKTEGVDGSDPIILDMFQTRTINQSRILGGGLLKQLERTNRLKFATVQAAPFRVLKLPQVPSVLIETAYISNAREEKLLRNDRFQARIAKAVATAIVEFVPPFPTVAVAVRDPEKTESKKEVGKGIGEKDEGKTEGAVKEAQGATAKERPKLPGAGIVRYPVRKGDTLTNIARKQGTSVKILLGLNRMKPGDSLQAGRIINIPGVGAGERKAAMAIPGKKPLPNSKAATVRYRVQKGDTLNKIALKHGTTLRALLELNHLKPSGPLYVGRELLLQGAVGY